MEEIIELCTLCSSGEEHTSLVLGSVLTFMLRRVSQVALPYMSAVDRGSLTLHLIVAGGLQHGPCHRFLFEELCPPYNTSLLVRLSHELYLRPVERMTAFTRLEASEEGRTYDKHSVPFLSLLRSGKDSNRAQPPVDFRGADVSELLFALLEAWVPAHPTTLSLGELPPGLATFLVLHYPPRTLALLRRDVVEPFVPSSWRGIWHELFVEEEEKGCVGPLHSMFVCGVCAGFWPALRTVFVNPLIGRKNGMEGEGGDGDCSAVHEGPTMLALHAVLRLWLGGLLQAQGTSGWSREWGCLEQNGSSFHSTVASGLWLLERDMSVEGSTNIILCAPYALLLVLYGGYCLASQVVRHALDHPNPTLFVPSFADVENDGLPLTKEVGISNGPVFFAALALRLPVSQLYIAGCVWRLLEAAVTSGGKDEGTNESLADVHSKILVLLSSYVYSGLRLEPFQGGVPVGESAVSHQMSSPSTASLRVGETPRPALRLKRSRSIELSPQISSATTGNGGGLKTAREELRSADIGAVASQLCGVLIEFSMKELSGTLVPVHPTAPAAPVGSSGGTDSSTGARLVLLTPPHIRGVLNLLSPASSTLPPALLATVRDVSCVLMSVLLYRRCMILYRWLLGEQTAERRTLVVNRLTRRVRQWGRFFAPLGLFRYAPVAEVLLPQCLQTMERKEAPPANDLRSDDEVAVGGFCGAVRALIEECGR